MEVETIARYVLVASFAALVGFLWGYGMCKAEWAKHEKAWRKWKDA